MLKENLPKNILQNNNIGIFPNRGIINSFFIVLGFITPFPIFINANKISIFLFEFDYSNIKTLIEEGTAVPVGVISLSIYIFAVSLRTRSLYYLIKYIFFILIILFVFLQGFDFIRIPVLIAPIIFLLFLRRIINCKYPPKDGFSLGYLLGLIAVYSSNIFSFIFFSFINNSPFDIQYSRQIFGYEVWQYYVTYPAVASLAFGTFALFLFLNFKFMKKISKFFYLVLFLSFIAAFLPLRKAAFLDMLFVIVLMFGSSIKELFNLKIKKYKFIIFLIVAFLSLTVIFLGINEREGVNYMTRITPIIGALNIIEIDPFKIFFGFQSGFGGYSNLFIELFLRTGLVGLTAYIGFIFYFFNLYLKSLKNIDGIGKFNNNSIVLFISFNLFIGNLVNLNFATPYFVVNFASIVIIFSYLDILSRIKNGKNKNLKINIIKELQ